MANLPIEIPPELLASGGTITIQKRKVSVTKGAAEPQTHQTHQTHQTQQTQQSTQQLAQPAPSSSTSERRSSKVKRKSMIFNSISFSLDDFVE